MFEFGTIRAVCVLVCVRHFTQVADWDELRRLTSAITVLCWVSLPPCLSIRLCLNSASIVGWVTLPFHKVRQGQQVAERTRLMTSSRTHGEGEWTEGWGVKCGAEMNQREHRGGGAFRGYRKGERWLRIERWVETGGSNYHHDFLCCTRWCIL